MTTFRRAGNWLNAALPEHWLPLLILLVPINFVVWQSDGCASGQR